MYGFGEPGRDAELRFSRGRGSILRCALLAAFRWLEADTSEIGRQRFLPQFADAERCRPLRRVDQPDGFIRPRPAAVSRARPRISSLVRQPSKTDVAWRLPSSGRFSNSCDGTSAAVLSLIEAIYWARHRAV